MSEEKNENGDSQNAEVEVDTTKEETTEPSEEKTEEEVKEDELTEREKQFFGRAKKSESQKRELKKQLGEAQKEIERLSKTGDKTTDKSKEQEEKIFFLENPDFKEQKDLIKSFQKDGLSLEEVIKIPIVKKTLDDLKALKESQTSKSVIHNNSRISTEDADKDKDFQEAKKTGNFARYVLKNEGK